MERVGVGGRATGAGICHLKSIHPTRGKLTCRIRIPLVAEYEPSLQPLASVRVTRAGLVEDVPEWGVQAEGEVGPIRSMTGQLFAVTKPIPSISSATRQGLSRSTRAVS